MDFSLDDYRLFCGDLGNEVNDEVLSKAFSRFPTFNMAKVSFCLFLTLSHFHIFQCSEALAYCFVNASRYYFECLFKFFGDLLLHNL